MSKYLMVGMAGFLMGMRYRMLGRKCCLKNLRRQMAQIMRIL